MGSVRKTPRSRRAWNLSLAGLVLAALVVVACAGSPEAEDRVDSVAAASLVPEGQEDIKEALEPVSDGVRTLVVYYTSGNASERVAADIAAIFGADLERIIESRPRKWSFFSGGAAAIFGTSVKLEPDVHDPADYGRVFVLSPVWAWRMAPPVRSWLKAHAGSLPEAAYGTISGDTEPEKIVAAMAKLAKRQPFAYAGFSESDFEPENRARYIEKLRCLSGIDKR